MRSNCLLFALRLAWRRRGHRGYVAMRKSDSGPFPHFLYFERHHVVSYKPPNPIARCCPPLVFSGRVCWGDEKH